MSLFTLGTMRALQSPEQMLQVLRATVAAGINHVETAPAYGPLKPFWARPWHNSRKKVQHRPTVAG